MFASHPDPPRLMSVRAACEYASIGKTKLYFHLRTGAIHAVKVGTRTLVVRASLDAFIAAQPAYHHNSHHEDIRHD